MQDVRSAERAAVEIQKMGIGGKRMSAADYRAARRAGTIGASAVGVESTITAQRCRGVSDNALLALRMHLHAQDPVRQPRILCFQSVAGYMSGPGSPVPAISFESPLTGQRRHDRHCTAAAVMVDGDVPSRGDPVAVVRLHHVCNTS